MLEYTGILSAEEKEMLNKLSVDTNNVTDNKLDKVMLVDYDSENADYGILLIFKATDEELNSFEEKVEDIIYDYDLDHDVVILAFSYTESTYQEDKPTYLFRLPEDKVEVLHGDKNRKYKSS